MSIRWRLLAVCLLAPVLAVGLGIGPVHAGFTDGDSVNGETVDAQFMEKVLQLETCLQNGQYVEARLLVLQLQQLFPRLSFAGRTGVEGIEAISETFVRLKQGLADVQLEPESIDRAARQWILALDALMHPDAREQSRWKSRLEEQLARLNDVRQSGNASPDARSLELLQEGYDELRPALLVRQPAVVGQLDALHQRMRQLSLGRTVSAEEWSEVLNPSAELYQQILRGKDRPALVQPLRAPFSRLTLGLAAFLILALSYTAWCYRTFRHTGAA